jgi:hypothetical protein
MPPNGPLDERDSRARGLNNVDIESIEGVVYLSEEFDNEIRRDGETITWSGKYSGHYEGRSVFEESPRGLSVAEALDWGRQRSPFVLIRPRNGITYSAGPVPYKGAPELPGEIDLRSPLLSERRATESDGGTRTWEIEVLVGTDLKELMRGPGFTQRVSEIVDSSPLTVVESPEKTSPPRYLLRVDGISASDAEKIARREIERAIADAISTQGLRGVGGWTISIGEIRLVTGG